MTGRFLLPAAELVALAAWALFVGRGYLNFDPHMVPTGGELGTHAAANHLWTRVLTCGWCAVWNSSVQGGLPALADTVSSTLHPVVMIATLLFGVVNGVKVTLLVALWLAGVAQWWMARELRLGAPARLWSGGIAVAGGHLASRMEIGNYQFLLAAAAASLFIAAILALARRGGLRLAVVAGVLLASFLVSGQAYLQLGFVALAPAVAFLVFEDGWRKSGRWKGFLIAGVLGLLLAAPFIVPMLHFLPNFAKEIDLSGFSAAQPVAFMPLNLVINDLAFYSSEALGKLPYVQLYSVYIGWVPVLLAAVGLATLKRNDRRAGWFLALGATLAFLASSPVLLRWIFKFWIGIGAIRWPSLFSTLSVPLTLALAAYGLDAVWAGMRGLPKLTLALDDAASHRRLGLPLQWILIVPLAISLRSVQSFAAQWYQVSPMPEGLYTALAASKTNTLQWVSPPWGTHYFIEAGIDTGLKLSPVFLPYRWNGREAPPAHYVLTYDEPAPDAVGVIRVGGLSIIPSEEEYAAVEAHGAKRPCAAAGTGGFIDVKCDVPEPGRLVVKENTWAGWNAWRDGKRVPLLGDKWLEVDAPAGMHTYEFRYLPWDVPLGLALFAAGVAVSVWLWRRSAASEIRKPKRGRRK